MDVKIGRLVLRGSFWSKLAEHRVSKTGELTSSTRDLIHTLQSSRDFPKDKVSHDLITTGSIYLIYYDSVHYFHVRDRS